MKYPTMLKPLFLSTTLAMSISLLSSGLSAAHAATGYKVHLQDADIKLFGPIFNCDVSKVGLQQPLRRSCGND